MRDKIPIPLPFWKPSPRLPHKGSADTNVTYESVVSAKTKVSIKAKASTFFLVKVFVGAVTSSSSCFVSSASLRKPQQRRGIFPFFRAFCQSSSLIVLCSNTFCELSLNLSHMLYNHFLLKTCGHQFFNHIALFLIRKNIFINFNLCLFSLFALSIRNKVN